MTPVTPPRPRRLPTNATRSWRTSGGPRAGRPGPHLGSDAERARVAVRRAIRTAYDRLGEVDPRLAEVLRREVTTGYQCSYRPLVGVTWRLDR